MNLKFADRLSGMRPSAAGNILKAGNDKTVISLAAGNPAPEAFPIDIITKIATEELHNHPVDVLQYSVPQGYAPLISAVEDMLTHRYGCSKSLNDTLSLNDTMSLNDTLIISGAQQGAELMAKLFCNEGDTVICEDPSFMGCLDAFRSYGVKTAGVPMEADGIDAAALEHTLQVEKNVRFMYLIPNFQNPTGITMSAAKRQRVYELAVKYNVLVLEDNPYGDLRFAGEAIPPIKSLDTTGNVVYMGSFSKIIAPGVRVGYVFADSKIIARLAALKVCDDVHTNILAQHICQRFITETDMDKHLSHLAEIYRKKCRLMLGEMDKHFSKKVTYTRPDGGLFLWCCLPNNMDSTAFCARAAENKVLVVPGAAFCADNTAASSCFRLNFSTPTDANIINGIEILGKLTQEI